MRKRILLWAAAAILVLCAAGVVLLRQGYLLPLWISWEQKELSWDCGTISLRNRTVTVSTDGDSLWQSGRDIPVQDVLWGDIDHDGAGELMLLCWKRGRYGESRPFWVTEDEKTWSQHIYLYDCDPEGVEPIWMASDIGREVVRWSFDEGARLQVTDRSGVTTCWDWISWGLSAVEPVTLTFGAVGDNLIHAPIYDYAYRHFGGEFDHLFAGVAEELAQYDVTSINQETILVEQWHEASDYPLFGTPAALGDAVVRAGFDIVSCATNHALDKGTRSIDLTASLYREAGVICAGIQPVSDGAYRPYALLERAGIRIAVCSFTQSTNGQPVPEEAPYVLHTLEDETRVRQALLQGEKNSDLMLVYVHWGTEYEPQPDESQRYWAQVFADCGADVVIGTHPHVLQPVEWVAGANGQETLVYYSLGNFISTQEPEACRIGGLAHWTVVKENGVCRIADYGLKQLITRQENGHYTTGLRNP